ncbi:MAG: hypothetical protein KIT25_15815 [Enhydrobacter sp.]|nr:MAG: hypothetical protein KIT25_15815 [Enhydrobacter sp.]
MRITLAVLAVLVLAGCVDRSQTRYYTREPFQTGSVAWAMGTGSNSLTGSAVFKHGGGEARPCTDVPVRLVPDSAYARLRLQELFGSELAGTTTGSGFGIYGPERFDAGWLEAAKTANCGVQGSFAFDSVPDGTWYVVSTWVAWDKDGRGSTMFKRVDLKGGQAVTINLP